MSNPAEAYGKTAKMAGGNPRDLEATLLIRAASQLQKIKDDWPDTPSDLDPALLYNRKLWTIFAASAAEADHPLPRDIKQNIANLAVFIFKQTAEIMLKPAPEKLDTLININRQIAAGLYEAGGQTTDTAAHSAT